MPKYKTCYNILNNVRRCLGQRGGIQGFVKTQWVKHLLVRLVTNVECDRLHLHMKFLLLVQQNFHSDTQCYTTCNCNPVSDSTRLSTMMKKGQKKWGAKITTSSSQSDVTSLHKAGFMSAAPAAMLQGRHTWLHVQHMIRVFVKIRASFV